MSAEDWREATPAERLAEAERRIEEARRSGAEVLDLGELGLHELPGSLGELPDLRKLYLSAGIFNLLVALQRLRDPMSPGVIDLAPLANLQVLQYLNLSSTRVTGLAPLAKLQGLQYLNLSSTHVTDFAPLAQLQGLQTLILSNTGITNVAPLAQLQGLQTLHLSFTGVTDLAPLAQLQGLRWLDISGCRPLFETFCGLADHPRLEHLIADEVTGIPREVLSHGYDDNCLPRLRTYLAELKLGAESEKEVKVILLGNGRVGKTQLCRRFRDKHFNESVESTHGVQIWRETLRLQAGGQEQVFQVNWWDFGGQDIYHGTHALFLRSRAVFLLLWTPTLENREEYSENGLTLRNQPLAYWLDYVRSLAGKGSPVIVVQSQCDRGVRRHHHPALLQSTGFEFLESCHYSAKDNNGREALDAYLRDAVRHLLEKNGALEIGQGRAEVRRRLRAWRSEDQEREPEERKHRTLSRDEFRALCDEAGGILSWEHALDYFHHTGVVFYRSDLFASRIILDQDWALDAIYTVFHRGRAVPWLRDSGRFTGEDLDMMVWRERYSPEEQRLFLGLMVSCGVCFPCGETAEGETRYVAPDLLPKFESIRSRLHAWKDAPDLPTLRLEYTFFHPAVIRNLMSRVGRQAEDLAEYWKYGLWFKDGQRDTQILVQFEDTSTDEAPGAGALVLQAQGRDPRGLLQEIRNAIPWHRIGEKPEESLTPATFAATFFEDRELPPLETSPPGEPPKLDIQPQRLGPGEKPAEVFLSYAWGDDTPEGKTRTKAVDGIYRALAEHGFEPVRDSDQIRPGERISPFMARLTSADLVVAVISDKYLRSYYCMYEIYRLWQRFQGNRDELARHVVPIVLPEVQVGSLKARAPYLTYWNEQKEEHDALRRKLDLSLSAEDWDEIRLVHEFSHHVAQILGFLNDVLMPRNLEAHLDDGFEAVREALGRRLRER